MKGHDTTLFTFTNGQQGLVATMTTHQARKSDGSSAGDPRKPSRLYILGGVLENGMPKVNWSYKRSLRSVSA